MSSLAIIIAEVKMRFYLYVYLEHLQHGKVSRHVENLQVPKEELFCINNKHLDKL